MAMTRRDLFKKSAVVGAGLVVAGNLEQLFAAAPAFAAPPAGAGPLLPDPNGILDLPDGFTYKIVSRAGDPMRGSAGFVPASPDGTGTFAAGRGLALVRNQELSSSSPFPAVAAPDRTYDPRAVGGTTTLLLDADNNVLREYVSLAGTVRNCAGGVTPWGTWLTCEEDESKAGSTYTRDHGFVFEVDPLDDSHNATPTPLTALGRYAHEAAIVDPIRGDVYLTEDASSPNGLLYRFVPSTRPTSYGDLRGGGSLYALYVPGVEDLSVFTEPGTTLAADWKPVPDPSAAATSTRKQFSYDTWSAGTRSGRVTTTAGAVTRSKKFEGLWWADGKAWIVASFAHGGVDWSGGEHDGQVWSYDPATSVLRLEVRFARATDPDGMPDGPDNITVSPYGGVFLAEDGDGANHLIAVSPSGEASFFARNALSDSEFAGVVFSPDAKTLFANIQGDGLTLAITGPFARFHRSR